MIEQQKMVHEFHSLYGIPVADTPTPLPADRVHLRVGLIREELEELEEALTDADPVATYDAAIDIMYVTLGMLVEMGMDVEPGFAEVHRSNLSKLGPDGAPIISMGEDVDGYPAGKVLKGPDYSPPDLARVLNEIGLPIPEEVESAASPGVVRTQEELDAALADGVMQIMVDSMKNDVLTVHESGSSLIHAINSTRMDVYESSTVYAYDSAYVVAFDSATVYAHDSSKVTAFDLVTVFAHQSSLVKAFNSSTVHARGLAVVHAREGAKVYARNSAVVHSYDSSTVIREN